MEQASKPDLCGVIVIDKPRGPTSMSMVNLVRRKCHKCKTGHAGTLDPLATGVLVLGVGKMTKKLGQMMNTDKRYTTIIDLSATTAGHDAESPRVEVEVQKPPTSEEVESAVHKFSGEIMQAPPIFSAVKVGGHRAYAVARKGKEVSIEPRKVTVHSISVSEYAWPYVTIDVSCAKGFYVRSLARDLGELLGIGGFCTEIRRTEVGRFTLDLAMQLEHLPEFLTQEDLISPAEVSRLLE
ncbi:MAG: tRNA pseudouridine(55) synthase TruB [Phycisphaerales bacterium]|nr:tRNA pseudouridine(55) synthase TruB [Planctomycetota bacterium]MBL6997405.1 tRNA pseudouridine(55) synthase TruB [Phycisphaerales bacterium]